MDFTIKAASTYKEKDDIAAFIKTYFVPDIPWVRVFGLGSNPPPPPSVSVQHAHPQDIYLQAKDRMDQLIGVAISRVIDNCGVEVHPDLKEVVDFLNYARDEAGQNELPEGWIELRVLTVHPECRKQGIAKSLTQQSVALAQRAGFKAMRGCFTSEYSARLARHLGWKEIGRLAYRDYPHLQLTSYPPHEYVYYYVKHL